MELWDILILKRFKYCNVFPRTQTTKLPVPWNLVSVGIQLLMLQNAESAKYVLAQVLHQHQNEFHSTTQWPKTTMLSERTPALSIRHYRQLQFYSKRIHSKTFIQDKYEEVLTFVCGRKCPNQASWQFVYSSWPNINFGILLRFIYQAYWYCLYPGPPIIFLQDFCVFRSTQPAKMLSYSSNRKFQRSDTSTIHFKTHASPCSHHYRYRFPTKTEFNRVRPFSIQRRLCSFAFSAVR